MDQHPQDDVEAQPVRLLTELDRHGRAQLLVPDAGALPAPTGLLLDAAWLVDVAFHVWLASERQDAARAAR